MSIWGIPIYIYRSITGGVRPSSLNDGQLFINQIDRVLCYPNSASTGTFSTMPLVSSKSVEVDFGSPGNIAKEFSITEPLVTTASVIIASPSAKNPTVGRHDEIDMDPFTVQGRCTINGTLILKLVSCTNGKLQGKRVVNYILA